MSDIRPDFLDLTPEQLRDEILADGIRRLTGELGDEVPPASLSSTIFETTALGSGRIMDTAVRPMAEQSNPHTATGSFLRLHGINAAVQFRTARATRGYATLTSAAGGTVPAGAVLEAGDQRFTVDMRIRLTAATATLVAVTAELAGAAGNVSAGTAVTISNPQPADLVARLDAQWITIYGHDGDDLSTPEGTERYRRRVLLGYRIHGDGRVAARYELAAFGVPDVSSVKVERTPRGLDSVNVATLFLGRLPDADQLDLVRAALDEEALSGGDVRAVAPQVSTVAVDARITGTATTADVAAAIDAWWRANIGIGDGVVIQQLYNRAATPENVPGLTSIVYTSPAGANLDPSAVRWYRPSISVTTA